MVEKKRILENGKCLSFHYHKMSLKINTGMKVPKKGRLNLPEVE